MGQKVFTNSENLFVKNSSLNELTSENNSLCSIGMSSMLAQSSIPQSHRMIADNYMVIKKLYGCNILQSKISNASRAKLAKYDFNPLEYSTIKQINEEISYLKKWSLSFDENLRKEADEILQIRSNELRYLLNNRYMVKTNEVYSGYKALEKYFEVISKYQ